jgi:hypothetical protein
MIHWHITWFWFSVDLPEITAFQKQAVLSCKGVSTVGNEGEILVPGHMPSG